MEPTEDKILEILPKEKPMRVSSIIKSMHVVDIEQARIVETILDILVSKGIVEKRDLDGKTFFSRI
jgi:predicted transcriptional regulator